MSKLVSKDILTNFIVTELELDQEFFTRIQGHLVKHLSEFREAGGDLKKLGQLAHKIRAACHSFGAIVLEAKLSEIEATARAEKLTLDSELFNGAVAIIDLTLQQIDSAANEIFKKEKKIA